jgi:hypothetical protein
VQLQQVVYSLQPNGEGNGVKEKEQNMSEANLVYKIETLTYKCEVQKDTISTLKTDKEKLIQTIDCLTKLITEKE